MQFLNFFLKNPKYPRSEIWMDVYGNKEARYYGLLGKDLSGFFVPEALGIKEDDQKKDD